MNKPQRRKQEDRRQDAESKLLDAAVELVAERGYDRFTLADVGEMANFSRGLPAHYFGTKDNLLSIVAERIVKLFLARLEDRKRTGAGMEPILESLRHIVQRTTEGQLASRALPVIIGAALVNPGLAASVKTLNDAGIDWIADVLRVGIASGHIRADIDPYCEAAAITATHRGLTLYYMLDPDFPIEKVMTNFIAELDKRLTIKPAKG